MIDDPLPSDARSALEACRADHQDERLPEIAATLANIPPERVAKARRSIEGVDRAVTRAIQQAPVPEGLAERVMARITIAQQPAAYSQAPSPRQGDELLLSIGPTDIRPADELATPAGGRRIRRSSMMLVACGSFALAATILIAFLAWPRGTVDLANVQSQAIEFYDSYQHRAAANDDALPTALGGVAADKVIGWHRVELFRRSGYGYDLANRRTKGTLYVLPLGSWLGPKLSGLNAVPVPQSTSGATVAAWTDGTHAYILVVKGGRPAFSSFLSQRVA
jgi:hypothetical protein